MSVASVQELLGCDVIVLIGAPLAGKSTQGTLLGKILERPYVSSGDLFRAEVALGSELGRQIKTYMDAGELIPNELTTTFLTAKLSDSLYQNGMILDGYPRNLSHLPIIEDILKNLDRSIFTAIYLEVSKSQLDERRSRRGRLDDNVDISDRRYAVFQEETLPLVESFRSKNRLIHIDCSSLSAEQVHQQILSELIALKQRSLAYLDSCQWLKANLAMGHADKKALLVEFRQRALDENEKQGRRTGILRRVVYLRTENVRKFQEHIQIFEKLYGIEVIRVPTALINGSDHTDAVLLLKEKLPGLVQLALITERSNLYRPGTNILSSLHHGVRAINQATLVALWIDPKTDEQVRAELTHSTAGRIDLQRRKTSDIHSSVFGWDDIFVVEANGMSYQQLKEAGIKHSARDMVISAFLKQRVHYKELLNLKFDPPQKAQRAIDFSVDVADFVSTNTTYNNTKVVEYGFRNLITHVLNTGVFFRAANNRRQANYWSPGLNGGLPLTAKDDAIHEDTFMAHDFGHFAIPDLVFTGTDSLLHRRAYIAWRMMSEATTMALADMLLIDALSKSNVQYNFDKRRIYPLFCDLNLDLSDANTRIHNLKEVIRANYKYCLLGDDSVYVQMLAQGRETPSLIEFKTKFGPFFVEDYRWTERNYDNMVTRSEELARWWSDVEPLRKLEHAENIASIDTFLAQIEAIRPEALTGSIIDFVDAIFDVVFDSKIRTVLDQQVPPLLEPSKRLFKAFTKWITAQLAITSKYHFLPESGDVRREITSYLRTLTNGEMTHDDVTAVRSMFEKYLHCLSEKSLISHDDEQTYAELYPLFDPFYVNYDKSAVDYEDLATISSRIFSLENYRQKQLVQAASLLGRSLTTNEAFYTSILLAMIEAGGGQTCDGMFVTRPGVMILSESPVAHRKGMVTFLLSGISLETSLEFVAHHEAKVARLTSSKTNAMNFPLFRVQGNDTSRQRQFLTALTTARNAFESVDQPRSSWGEHGNEIFNSMQPGCKVTAVCYTMSLEDFHKLFIGRLSASGNEQEVIHVAHRMATLLHALYPDLIQEPTYYVSCGNATKYLSNAEPVSKTNPHDDPTQGITIVGKSKLTKAAARLMTTLNLAEGDDFRCLAEFRSRITYLAFPKSPATSENQQKYLDRIVNQHSHWSVLDACQLIFRLPTQFVDFCSNSTLNSCAFELTEQGILLFATLKQIRQAVIRSVPTDPHHDTLVSIQKLIQWESRFFLLIILSESSFLMIKFEHNCLNCCFCSFRLSRLLLIYARIVERHFPVDRAEQNTRWPSRKKRKENRADMSLGDELRESLIKSWQIQ